MNRVITILIIVLLIVLGALVGLWLLPRAQDEPLFVSPAPSPQPETPLFSDTPPPATTDTRVFNLDVLRGTLYQSLNHQLIDNGSLPVQPPAATGKANPFL